MRNSARLVNRQAAMRERMLAARCVTHGPLARRPKRFKLKTRPVQPDPAKEPRRRWAREWMRKRRDEWFTANGPCVDCGTWEGLELDHNDPATKISHRIWSWSEKRRLRELAKCSIRCRPCHQLRHNGPTLILCGTTNAYRAGCRCDSCRSAHASYRRSYREKFRVPKTLRQQKAK